VAEAEAGLIQMDVIDDIAESILQALRACDSQGVIRREDVHMPGTFRFRLDGSFDLKAVARAAYEAAERH
jgi:hypothetical protein